MQYVMIILGAYLIGCSSMSYYISRINKIDIKGQGSKNYGASNTVALVGWKAGILVGVHDIGKAILAVCVARALFPDVMYAGAIAGVACVLGHIFPFYLQFNGGKGFASFVGMMFALDWKLGIVVGIGIILLALITDYIVSGTMMTITVVPVYLGFANHSWMLAMIIAVASFVILYKHRENLVRMYNGTETGIRSANRGELRVKK